MVPTSDTERVVPPIEGSGASIPGVFEVPRAVGRTLNQYLRASRRAEGLKGSGNPSSCQCLPAPKVYGLEVSGSGLKGF